MPSHTGFIALAQRRDVVRRAGVTALVVGLLLIGINHGAALLRGELDTGRWLQMLLTVAVPYCVSTYASVRALQGVS